MTQAIDTTEAGLEIQFMLPGFSKCGTTTLYTLLDEHPAICMSSNKEPSFFIGDDYRQHWSSYRALFPQQAAGLVLGEATTMYSSMRHEQASRDRILQHFPDIKLIFVARDPLKRIESSFREIHHSGHHFGLDADFDPNRAIHQLPALLDDSLYFQRLHNYRQRIPEQRILVIFLDDLIADTAGQLRRCFDFLGVDPTPADSIPLRTLNASEEKLRDSPMLRHLRRHPLSRRIVARLNAPEGQKMLTKLGLRKRFDEKIAWSDATLALIARTLRDDTRQFLESNGKPADFWPGFAAIAKRFH
jgi:hypothetical protein